MCSTKIVRKNSEPSKTWPPGGGGPVCCIINMEIFLKYLVKTTGLI